MLSTKDQEKYLDGDGLYLQVHQGKDGKPHKSWYFRFKSPETGKERFMGLGSFKNVSLDEARIARSIARQVTNQGLDPIEERVRQKIRRQRDAQRLDSAILMSVRLKSLEAQNEKGLRQLEVRNAKRLQRLVAAIPDSKDHFTYLFIDPTTLRLKIGRSTKVQHRLHDFANLIGTEPHLIAVIEHDCEKALHKRFKHARLRGEWFDARDPLIAEYLLSAHGYYVDVDVRAAAE